MRVSVLRVLPSLSTIAPVPSVSASASASTNNNDNGDDKSERHMHIRDVRSSARSSRMELSLEWRNARDARISAIFGRKGYYMIGSYIPASASFYPVLSPFPPSRIPFTAPSRACIQCMHPDHRRSAALSFPLCCHCANLPFAPLGPIEVVARGQLSTATKKAHLLCGWDPESREVTYNSIEWAGFG